MKQNDDLKQIKELLEIVAHKVDMMEVSRTGQSASLHLMKDQQSVMNTKLDTIQKDLNEVKETQQNHTGSLMNIEATLEGYADSYKENQRNIERLDTRLSEAEEELNIEVPEELKVPHCTAE